MPPVRLLWTGIRRVEVQGQWPHRWNLNHKTAWVSSGSVDGESKRGEGHMETFFRSVQIWEGTSSANVLPSMMVSGPALVVFIIILFTIR